MEERILKLINSKKYQPLSVQELANELGLEFKDVMLTVDDLISKYEVFINRNNKILNKDQANRYLGTISLTKSGLGFITYKEELEDLFVGRDDLNSAMDGDLVLFKADPFFEKAIVIEVVKRNVEYLVGEVSKNRKTYFLNTEDYHNLVLLKQDQRLAQGDVIKVKIIEYHEDYLVGQFHERIGRYNDFDIDILSLISKFGFSNTYPEYVNKAAEALEVNSKQELSKRKLIEKRIVTIDGDDAKDFDDAISIEKLDNGNYLLGVYIADVGYFVEEGSVIDQESYNRGTSVYIVDRVLPMLPFKLSNDLCSLQEGKERLAIACFMEIDSNGRTVDTVIEKVKIKSSKRWTYKEVNEIIEQELETDDPLINDLYLMDELALILEDKRNKRGSVDFDIPELKVFVDDECKPYKVEKVERGRGEKLIESFMIETNEAVATYITNMNLPFIYRIHDKPEVKKIKEFRNILRNTKYKFNPKNIKSKDIQVLVNSFSKEDEYLNMQVLRLMSKAIYANYNIGHFGLASKCYTHFTAPIRRYPDLIVHRLIRRYLFDSNYKTNSEYNKRLKEIALHSSTAERNADSLEYAVLDLKLAEYMEKYVGKVLQGKITSILSFGMFVSVLEGIEGLVHINNMPGFRFDEQRKMLVSYNRSYRLGDKVKVMVVGANKEKGKIDFEIVK
ncbi:MAG TPA: ribonuclease R [Acholeplasma sp.]|nr:ribonuclease R [Acholeplasma sp.]